MPPSIPASKPRIDLSRYELSVDGRRVKLERQPMELLILFVQRQGQLVTRDEIIGKLWGNDVFVDADRSINAAVRKIRTALRDDPANPKFLETVIGKGYRLVGEVEVVGGAPAPETQLAEPEAPAAKKNIKRLLSAIALLLGVVFVALWVWRQHVNRVSPDSAIHSIAVLPLANLSADPSQEYFSDGLTDELITELAQISSLRIISRTSVMHYKGTMRTAPQIAQELNVDAVLEGSVQRSGDRVRITAQLIAARQDKHLWASSYEEDFKNVLSIQDEIARDVANQIQLRLTSQQHARLSRSRSVNPEAHEAYLKGLYYWSLRGRNNIEKAVDYFNQAIALDPGYALPYAGLAQCYIPLNYFSYISGREARAKSIAAAEKALQLDDSIAEAHTALGSAKSFYDHDWEGADREFRKAIQLNPSYATGHHWYAQMLVALEQNEQALAESQRARDLDPWALIISSGWAGRLYWMRRYDEAIAHIKNTIELDSNFAVSHWEFGSILVQKKDFPDAIRELHKAESLAPDNSLMLGGLGYAYAASGDSVGANAVLHELHRRAAERYVSPYDFVVVYAGLDDKDRAFAWLQKAEDDLDCRLMFLNVEPMLDNLRPDPRFQEFVKHVGLSSKR
jgi:TolB-like protein/DNA-binding winged helix-turn-helix (wHTH) protein/Tfp pilus assembly protein PilF